jgi:hypothetical protein
MRPIISFSLGLIAAVPFFALYFCCIVGVFSPPKTLAEFSAMFQPLEALFTALAFFALVLTIWWQSEELRKTKKETAEALVLAIRLQASGMRLISMAVEDDSNTGAARRELERQIEELEQRLENYVRHS